MNEKLNDALNQISDQYLEEAAKPLKKKQFYWLGTIAAILIIALLAGILGRTFSLPGSTNPSVSVPSFLGSNTQYDNLLAAPIYPKMVKYPQGEDGSYADWNQSQQEQYDQPKGYADNLNDFFSSSIRIFLQGEGNQVYSPVNVYMAMAMLAECVDGTSRQQILELLGAGSITELRRQASRVWNAHFSDDGLTTLLLANSVWMDNAYDFNQDTVNTLANSYYASSFYGDLGTEEMDQQLRQWLNDYSGDLLQEQALNTKLDADSAAALASTIYFSAQWEEKFFENQTTQAVFHSPDEDIAAWFMHRTFSEKLYFQGENYGAVSLRLSGDNNMWLFLPEEGITAGQLLESGDFLSMLQNPEKWEQQTYCKVHLSMPKLDIRAQNDLIAGMKKLGITDIFDSQTADLSGLIAPTFDGNAYVGQIDHAARVTVDEEGCIAAAYIVIDMPTDGMPQERDDIYFTLDRPFIFVITSRDNLPLFAGVVNTP